MKAFTKELIDVLSGSKISMLAAQIGFFLLLAFFPFCMLLFIVIGQFHLDGTYFIETVTSILPPQIAPLMEQVLRNVNGNTNIFWSLAGIITTIWVSTRAAHAMIAAVDKFQDKPHRRPLSQRMGLAVLLMIGLVVFILLSAAFLILGRETVNGLMGQIGLETFSPVLSSTMRIAGALLALTIFFTALYTVSTSNKILIKNSIIGAIFSAFSWFVLTYAFSIIISRFFVLSSIYGSLGSIILMIMWLFWGSHVIVIGAAINRTIQNLTNHP